MLQNVKMGLKGRKPLLNLLYGMVWYGMVWYGGAILILVNPLYKYTAQSFCNNLILQTDIRE